jgi:hypothetical protein
MIEPLCRWNLHNMSQLPERTPKEGEEVFAAVIDNKHNKTHVSP